MRMDLTTAQWLVEKAQTDMSVFPVEFDECEKCGAAYLPFLDHNCEQVLDVPTHHVKETDKIEPIA